MEDILASIRRIIAEDEDTAQQHYEVDAVVNPQVVESMTQPEPVEEAAPANVQNPFETQNSFDAGEDEEDILLLDQLVSEAGLDAQELTAIETDELLIDNGNSDAFNPVSSVVSDLEDRLNDDIQAMETDVVTDDNSVVFSLEDESTAIRSKTSIGADILSLLDDDPIEDIMVPTGQSNDEAGDDFEEFNLEDLIQDPVDTPKPVETLSDIDVDSESDLDIVKSLMADLADTSFMDDPVDDQGQLIESVAEEDVVLDSQFTDSLLVQDDEMPMAALEESLDLVIEEPAAIAEDEDDQDQIINDILELALQDEEGTVAELDETVDLAIDDELTIPDMEPSDATEDSLLLQIAAEAEAEADAMDGTTAMAVGAGALSAAANLKADDGTDGDAVEMDLPDEDTPSTQELLNELDLALAEVTQDDNQEETELALEPVTETDLVSEVKAETKTETEIETTDLFVEPEEAEDMPKAARKDAIINEVTEEASAGAFAELSQAVEEKAVYTESGPRVGDIVQDALRPMLKEWLDENLKGIVERAVAKEVKRISSGK